MLSMLDTLSLKNTRLGLETLDLMGYDRERTVLVLNRADSRVGISDDDVERIVGRKPEIRVPERRRDHALGQRRAADRARRGRSRRPLSRSGGSRRCSWRASGTGLRPRRSRTRPTKTPSQARPPAPTREEATSRGSTRASDDRAARRRRPVATIPFAELKNRVHLAVIGVLGPRLFNAGLDPAALREQVLADTRRHLAQEPGMSRDDRERLANEIADDALGHGPLERLLADDSVTEIMVNGPYDIWIERQGRLYETNVRFDDESHLRRIINKIVAEVGRRVDESSPMVDARLPDGSRVNIIIPPLSLSGALITIRKFTQNKLQLDDLIRNGTISAEAVDFLERCVHRRAQHPHLRRNRLRKDDAAERALRGDPGHAPDRHDRGRSGAPAQPAPRAPPRGAHEEHRGRGRGRRSATSSGTRCACGPTGSSSARFAAPRRSTCSRR